MGEKEKDRMSDIVVGYDGSDCSKQALASAADLAGALHDSLRVVFAYAPGGYGGGEVPAQREAVKELGEGVVAEAKSWLDGRDPTPAYETELLPLRPADALVRAADEHDTRMIVVGTHGQGALRSALIGSTPYKLIHQTDIPVLVVPAKEN
jgi:nucleotide-binding universal stress UspA family protein